MLILCRLHLLASLLLLLAIPFGAYAAAAGEQTAADADGEELHFEPIPEPDIRADLAHVSAAITRVDHNQLWRIEPLAPIERTLSEPEVVLFRRLWMMVALMDKPMVLQQHDLVLFAQALAILVEMDPAKRSVKFNTQKFEQWSMEEVEEQCSKPPATKNVAVQTDAKAANETKTPENAVVENGAENVEKKEMAQNVASEPGILTKLLGIVRGNNTADSNGANANNDKTKEPEKAVVENMAENKEKQEMAQNIEEEHSKPSILSKLLAILHGNNNAESNGAAIVPQEKNAGKIVVIDLRHKGNDDLNEDIEETREQPAETFDEKKNDEIAKTPENMQMGVANQMAQMMMPQSVQPPMDVVQQQPVERNAVVAADSQENNGGTGLLGFLSKMYLLKRRKRHISLSALEKAFAGGNADGPTVYIVGDSEDPLALLAERMQQARNAKAEDEQKTKEEQNANANNSSAQMPSSPLANLLQQLKAHLLGIDNGNENGANKNENAGKVLVVPTAEPATVDAHANVDSQMLVEALKNAFNEYKQSKGVTAEAQQNSLPASQPIENGHNAEEVQMNENVSTNNVEPEALMPMAENVLPIGNESTMDNQKIIEMLKQNFPTPSDDTEEASEPSIAAQIDELKNAKSDELKNAKIDELKNAKIDELKNAKIDELKNAKIDELKNAKIDELKNADANSNKAQVAETDANANANEAEENNPRRQQMNALKKYLLEYLLRTVAGKGEPMRDERLAYVLYSELQYWLAKHAQRAFNAPAVGVEKLLANEQKGLDFVHRFGDIWYTKLQFALPKPLRDEFNAATADVERVMAHGQKEMEFLQQQWTSVNGKLTMLKEWIGKAYRRK